MLINLRDTRVVISTTAPNAVLIDDHALFRTGLRMIVQSHPQIHGIAEAGSVREAEAFASAQVQLVFLDVQLPQINGLDGIRWLRSLFPNARILVVSASIGEQAEQLAQERGAHGYVSKAASADDILGAISSLLAGKMHFSLLKAASTTSTSTASRLTHRQLEVLRLLADGKSNKLIARSMELSESTVRVHVAAIFTHFDVNSRTAATLAAQRAGLVGLGGTLL